MNTMALTLKEISSMFDGFSPQQMIIDRSNGTIKWDLSALENISIAMLSDY